MSNTLLLLGLLTAALFGYSKGYFNPIISKLKGDDGADDGGGPDITDAISVGTPTPPVSGSAPTTNYVPVLGKDLTVQQQTKYRLVPGTEGKGPAGTQLYSIGGKRRVITGNYESGSQGASDGIRNNIINQADLVNREVTWIFTLRQVLDSKGKDHYGSKCGSHSDSGSQLYTNSVQYFVSGPLKWQQESPHGRYVKCGTCGKQVNPCPAIATKTAYPVTINKKIGWKY